MQSAREWAELVLKDVSSAFAFADWLEERGDPRSQYVRLAYEGKRRHLEVMRYIKIAFFDELRGGESIEAAMREVAAMFRGTTLQVERTPPPWELTGSISYSRSGRRGSWTYMGRATLRVEEEP
jgi:hypothetical protein